MPQKNTQKCCGGYCNGKIALIMSATPNFKQVMLNTINNAKHNITGRNIEILNGPTPNMKFVRIV